MASAGGFRYLRGMLFALAIGCTPLELDPALPYAKVVYDPATGDIPLPNDAARDADAGRLDLPTDSEGLTEADIAFRTYLNGMDAWGTTFPVAVEFNVDVDPDSLGAVEVWEWGIEPKKVADLEAEPEARRQVLQAPLEGWKQGGTYVVIAREIESVDGVLLGPDAAFTYLRLTEKLDTVANQRAFPGADRAERLANAAKLEEIRLQIAPYLDFFEADGIPRTDVAALWSFTVTQDFELAMDRASQRVPLPFDLLIDPDTGLVDLSPSELDDELEADAKLVANTLEGFGLSANPFFEPPVPSIPRASTDASSCGASTRRPTRSTSPPTSSTTSTWWSSSAMPSPSTPPPPTPSWSARA